MKTSTIDRLARMALLSILMSCAASVHSEARTISDPVQFIVDQGGVERDDALSVVKFDWNEDAQDDYFIIVESERAGAYGNVTWTVYLSDGKGKYAMETEALQAPAEGLQVARLDEVGGKQVVIAVGNRGVETPINGYYLDGEGHIAIQILATLRRESAAADDDEMAEIAAENEAQIKRFLTEPKVIGYETIRAAERLPSSR